MARSKRQKPQPEVSTIAPPAPVVYPDVSPRAHSTGSVAPQNGPSVGPAGPDQLQNVLPEINEIAQKVGGFKKLAEIAGIPSSNRLGNQLMSYCDHKLLHCSVEALLRL
jgi:hypothetical protein